MELSLNIFIAVSIYILAIVSPGPSNLAIAHTSIFDGRKAGVLFAFGVLCGSFFWGILAASGLEPILKQYSQLLYILKILGGVYFLYLAYKTFNGLKSTNTMANENTKTRSNKRYFISGLMMHLLNPKAIAVWIAIIAVALPTQANDSSIFLPVFLCLPFGIIVFIGYAYIFSAKSVVEKYFSFKKYIDITVGTIFTFVGLKLIFSSEK